MRVNKIKCHVAKVYVHVYASDLTISLRAVENSPVKDFSKSISSQRDALNSISKGLKPLFAILFTIHRRYIEQNAYNKLKAKHRNKEICLCTV